MSDTGGVVGCGATWGPQLYFGPRRCLRLSDFDTHTMCAVRLVGASDQMHAVMDRGDAFRYGGYIVSGVAFAAVRTFAALTDTAATGY